MCLCIYVCVLLCTYDIHGRLLHTAHLPASLLYLSYRHDHVHISHVPYITCTWPAGHHVHMGWLWSVGPIKLYVSFAEYRLFYRSLLRKRPIILSILLSVATPYVICTWPASLPYMSYLHDRQVDRKKTPPGIYYVPWSRTRRKRTPLEEFVPGASRGVLFLRVLDQGI